MCQICMHQLGWTGMEETLIHEHPRMYRTESKNTLHYQDPGKVNLCGCLSLYWSTP